MPLSTYPSLCTRQQKIIVSKDSGESRKHIAENDMEHFVTQYRIDGVVICQGSRCDYLLIDEDRKYAYLIELKGSDLNKAVLQLETTAQVLRENLRAYQYHYRIVASKSTTHQLESVNMHKFKRNHHGYYKIQNVELREKLL